MEGKILIIEDDKTMAIGLCRAFRTERIEAEYVGTLRQVCLWYTSFNDKALV